MRYVSHLKNILFTTITFIRNTLVHFPQAIDILALIKEIINDIFS